jgi:hypothetical protein
VKEDPELPEGVAASIRCNRGLSYSQSASRYSPCNGYDPCCTEVVDAAVEGFAACMGGAEGYGPCICGAACMGGAEGYGSRTGGAEGVLACIDLLLC